MSRIIKKIIKFLMLNINIVLILSILVAIVFLLNQNIYGFGIMWVTVIIIIYLKVCIDIFRKLNKSVHIFAAGSKIRNVDYLVIGDMVDTSDLYSNGKTVVELCVPNRNLMASYELLRHTYSILKENGTVIIACQDRNISKQKYTFYDIAYFHPVTLKRLGLVSNSYKKILSLLFKPGLVIQLWLNRRMKYEKKICENEAIIKFCESRGLELEYRKCI